MSETGNDDPQRLTDLLTQYRSDGNAPLARMWDAIELTLGAARTGTPARWSTAQRVGAFLAAAAIIGLVSVIYRAAPMPKTRGTPREYESAVAELTAGARAAVRSAIGPLDAMIRETTAAASADLTDPFLRRHLAELREQRAALVRELLPREPASRQPRG